MASELDRLLDREQLRVILAVTQAKSFSGAAALLGVSQPSVSQQIKRLERLSGITLFRRNRRGIELTSEGEAVVIYARAVASLTDELKKQLQQPIGAVVSIGMSEDFCRTALPAILSVYKRGHPGPRYALSRARMKR